MELHTQFEHFSGLEFTFNGDDDVWVFVNNKLVMDLGFVHGPTSGTVDFTSLPLKYGETYPLSLFYCERKPDNSTIRIETNIPVTSLKGKMTTNWKRDYGEMN
jgi:fibro-slime domain-containing protein